MDQQKPRLLLIDGSALLHRAYHALPGLTDRRGRPTGAMYGFVRMLLKAIKDLRPTHVAVAFDRPEPTFRKQLYIAYQAQRPEVPADLIEQFIRVRELLAAMEVPVYEKAGYEADDVIGSITYQVSGIKYGDKASSNKKNIPKTKYKIPDTETIILTGDKDLMQLVNDQVKIYLPIKGVSETELVGSPEVEEKLGVRPEQVVDYKALTGDPSDNYPGVPGVGPKTAAGLLHEFGSFVGIYDELKTPNQESGAKIIPDSVKNKLLQGQEAGKLSKELAQIRTDVDINFDLSACEAVVKQPGHLARVLEEFGFNSLVKQMELETTVGQGMEQMKLVL